MKWTGSRTVWDLRASAKRCLPAALCGTLAVSAYLATEAFADVFTIDPSVFLEQIFVDNVRSSSNDRDADGITAITARLDTVLKTSNIEAVARVEGFYNEVWAANDLDSVNARGDAGARVKLYRDQVFVDGTARRQQIFLTPTGSGGSSFLTGQNQQQETDYSVSPAISTEVLGLADLLVRGTYAQVLFDEPVVGPTSVLLDDVTLKEVSGRLGTGKRASLYEASVTAEYLETDNQFQERNVIGSLFLNLTNKFTAIGRIGYERITDPTIVPIRGTIWSAGGRLAIGRDSHMQVEYGRRFGDSSWLGELNVVLSPYVTVEGSYKDTLVPIQLTYFRDLNDLFNDDGLLQIPSPQAPGNIDPTVLDQIVRDKDLQLLAIYKIDLRSFEFSIRHIERQFIQAQDTEKLYDIRLSVDEQLSRKLSYIFAIDVFETYAPLVGNAQSQNYSVDLAVRYQVSTNTRVSGGYLWRLQAAEDNNDSYENVLRVGVEQHF